MQNCWDYLQSYDEIAVAIRLVIATAFGSFIGWERIARKHSAGIKTFALVSLGAAVATVLNIYLAQKTGLKADVGRIPAQVVSGIGFLGAGTILLTGRNQVKGLTTAASLWVTAMMGMVIGGGFLLVGIVCFALIMLANSVLLRFSNRVAERNRYLNVYLEVEKAKGVTRLRKLLTESSYELISMTKSKEKTLQDSDVAIVVEVDLGGSYGHTRILNMLNNLDYVNYIEEI